MTVSVDLPAKLVPVFEGEADYRGAYGGRGSGKTRSFAKMAAVYGVKASQSGQDGVIVCAREFMNSLADSSFAEVKGAIESEPWLTQFYDMGTEYIRTKDGRINFVFCGMRHNIASIKSKAKIRLLWVDEAEPVTETAWSTADNTVREDGAETWATWNPERKASDTNKRFRETQPPRSKFVELNWRDNPWFPDLLNRKRLACKENNPDQYDHIWEGGYKTAVEGAYYTKCLTDAKADGRICRLSVDPLMTIKLFCDIGGTGARSDAFTIWASQFIGKEIRHLNYYEAVGQDLAAHLTWCRSQGYEPGRVEFILPHDGASHDKVFNVSYESALRQAGYRVAVIPNQGPGAATQRIEAARRLFPRMWFDEVKTEAGRQALGWYHEKKDEKRNIGLGPEHDWSSNGADSFGLSAVAYKEPTSTALPRVSGWSNPVAGMGVFG